MKVLYLLQGLLGAFVDVVLIVRGAPCFSVVITAVASAVGFWLWRVR